MSADAPEGTSGRKPAGGQGDVTIRPGVGDEPESKVTTSTARRAPEKCAHGLELYVVDGERWHRDERSDLEHVDLYLPCPPEIPRARRSPTRQ